ncbi:MAG: site-2 protease family protein [Chloroflexota bacterium]
MRNLPQTYFPIPLETVEHLRNILSEYFEVGDTSIDVPADGYVRFRGRFIQDLASCFNSLKEKFEEAGFTPIVRNDEGRTAVIAIPEVTVDTPANWPLAITLFVATILSTMVVGASSARESADAAFQLWRGWPFSLSIMLILTAHELGHYFAARYHKVPVSPPYFIPLPSPLIGTMGAFIRLKGRPQNKRVLMDIGASGPLAGMIFAIPILIIGLMTSEVGPLPTEPYLLEGNSILYFLTKLTIFQQVLPGNGMDVSLNQVAWAGWVGFLVTALNLMPLGQLDGGHMAYVIFGQRAKQFFWPVIIALGALSLFTASTTWIVWIALLFFFGRVHAEPLDDVTELDPRRRVIAIFTLVLFFLIFPPIPIQFIFP